MLLHLPDHGATLDGDPGGGLSASFGNYAQGMWYVSDKDGTLFSAPEFVGSGDGSDSWTHSLGAVGFFPWLDRTSADPTEHHWGAMAIDMQEIWSRDHDIFLYLIVPLMLVALAACPRAPCLLCGTVFVYWRS